MQPTGFSIDRFNNMFYSVVAVCILRFNFDYNFTCIAASEALDSLTSGAARQTRVKTRGKKARENWVRCYHAGEFY